MSTEAVQKFEQTITKKAAKPAKLKVDEDGDIHIEGMDYSRAITALQRKRDEEERVVSFFEEFRNEHCLDAAVNFTRAIAEVYGWVDMRPTPGFWGSTPPMMIPVTVGVDEVTHVPLGSIHLPNIGEINAQIHFGNKPPFFFVSAETKQKNVPELKKLVAKTREFLHNQSIYNGKAIKVTFEWMQPHVKQFDIAKHSPQFIDLSNVKEGELIFSKKVERNLNVGLWTSIEHMGALKDAQIPFKRGVLLIGKYGVGKTLAALITAKKATAAGVGFMYLDTVLSLPHALQMIQKTRGTPWVLFAEDVERVIGGQERTPDVDLVLNTIDGLDSKDSNIITVFTTNHPREINQAFLRDGRIDKKILITAPDAEAAGRLVAVYGRGLLSPDVDLENAGRVLAGRTPATIRKIVEESKLSAIYRTHGGDVIGKVNLEDLIYATEDHDLHEQLVKPKENDRKDLSVHVHIPNVTGNVEDVTNVYALNDEAQEQQERYTNGRDQQEVDSLD